MKKKDKKEDLEGIKFVRTLDSPDAPGHIVYYPPKDAEDHEKKIRNKKILGLVVYIIGFMVIMMAYAIPSESGNDAIRILPILNVLGLVFAAIFVFSDEESMAKLSRTLPLIVMIVLVLAYVMGILQGVMGLTSIDTGVSDPSGIGDTMDQVNEAVENLFNAIVDVSIFFFAAGLMICRGGGQILLGAKRVGQGLSTPAIIVMGDAMPLQKSDVPKCPDCGEPLDHIEEYDRWYCHDCNKYAPKEVAKAAGPVCASCGGALKFIEEYGRWYCESCKVYAPKEEAKEVERESAEAPEPPAPADEKTEVPEPVEGSKPEEEVPSEEESE